MKKAMIRQFYLFQHPGNDAFYVLENVIVLQQ
jgi:hypothetical protein